MPVNKRLVTERMESKPARAAPHTHQGMTHYQAWLLTETIVALVIAVLVLALVLFASGLIPPGW